MKLTTFRQLLTARPDVTWRHHSGELMTTEVLANRLSGSLDADAAFDEQNGTLYRFHEIARIVEATREEEMNSGL